MKNYAAIDVLLEASAGGKRKSTRAQKPEVLRQFEKSLLQKTRPRAGFSALGGDKSLILRAEVRRLLEAITAHLRK